MLRGMRVHPTHEVSPRHRSQQDDFVKQAQREAQPRGGSGSPCGADDPFLSLALPPHPPAPGPAPPPPFGSAPVRLTGQGSSCKSRSDWSRLLV